MASIEIKSSISGSGGYGAMLLKDLKMHRYIYIMLLPVIAFYAIFCYAPMYGIVMAFQDYNISKHIIGSDWVGFKHFFEFFNGPYFLRTLRNTLVLNLYGLVFSFPVPIIFALLINEVSNKVLKRTVQTISYLPYFVSIVVVAGIIQNFCSSNGMLTYLYKAVMHISDPTNLLIQPGLFRAIYILSDIWQYAGFSSIIYISALSGINPELYEAAIIDGAGRWKRMIHITLSGIRPTIIMLFILQVGSIMSVGFDKVFLIYNPSIYETADVISTYIYRQGLQQMQISYSTAVGVFNSVTNFIILVTANRISTKVSEVGLF